MITLFLERGVKPISFYGSITRGQESIVKLLLYANPNLIHAKWPFVEASDCRNEAIRRLFIDAGADPNYYKWNEESNSSEWIYGIAEIMITKSTPPMLRRLFLSDPN